MALFVRQDEQRTQLQKKVAAELKGKLKTNTRTESEKTEPVILENEHPTRPAGMAIIILSLLLIILGVIALFITRQ